MPKRPNQSNDDVASQLSQSGNARDRTRTSSTTTTTTKSNKSGETTLTQQQLIHNLFENCTNNNMAEMKIIIKRLQQQYKYSINLRTAYDIELVYPGLVTYDKRNFKSLFHAAVLSNSPQMIDFVLELYRFDDNDDDKKGVRFAFADDQKVVKFYWDIGTDALEMALDNEKYDSIFHVFQNRHAVNIDPDFLAQHIDFLTYYLLNHNKINVLKKIIKIQGEYYCTKRFIDEEDYYRTSWEHQLAVQLVPAALEDDKKLIKTIIINMDASIDTEDPLNCGHTVLFHCARAYKWDMVRYLIKTFNAKIWHSNSPLCHEDAWSIGELHPYDEGEEHYYCCASILQFVIQDPNLTTKQAIELIDYFVQIDPNVVSHKNYHREIPIAIAHKLGKSEIVDHFIKKYNQHVPIDSDCEDEE